MAIKAVIGLGNPGERFQTTRHNIGFLVADALVDRLGGDWRLRDQIAVAQVAINDQKVLVVKPQTFMNNSGNIMSFLTKQGIKAHEIIVVHDELEFPFGKITSKRGGSARGHNGVKSIMAVIGDDFYRVRCGIDRPEDRAEVANYVLQRFVESDSEIEEMVRRAVDEVIILAH